MLNDYNVKKDFMVEWFDNKGNSHKTKVFNKFISANEAVEYILTYRKLVLVLHLLIGYRKNIREVRGGINY